MFRMAGRAATGLASAGHKFSHHLQNCTGAGGGSGQLSSRGCRPVRGRGVGSGQPKQQSASCDACSWGTASTYRNCVREGEGWKGDAAGEGDAGWQHPSACLQGELTGPRGQRRTVLACSPTEAPPTAHRPHSAAYLRRRNHVLYGGGRSGGADALVPLAPLAIGISPESPAGGWVGERVGEWLSE